MRLVRYARNLIELAIKERRDPAMGVDIVLGAMPQALFALHRRPDLSGSYPEEFIFHVLLGLGLPRSAARRLVGLPIQPVVVPPESLLARTQPATLSAVDFRPV